MADITVECACGWRATGEEADVVERTKDHGRAVHNMEATDEQVMAMAKKPGD